MATRISPWAILLLVFLGAQVNFWMVSKQVRPTLEIVSEPPKGEYLKALAMGDDQMFFRATSFMIQNMGDTWGRFTSLKLYDLAKLSRWFAAMDMLDPKSDMIPSMAAYYFGQTQKTEDVRYMANYLYDHAIRDVPRKWWWLLQGMYQANHKLHDSALTLKMAKPLITPGVPVWAQQMLAVTYEKQGEFEDALHIMETIRDNAEQIPDRDLKYMNYFVKERLNRLEEFNRSVKRPHE